MQFGSLGRPPSPPTAVLVRRQGKNYRELPGKWWTQALRRRLHASEGSHSVNVLGYLSGSSTNAP
jgi:hypothetical protein